jgi:hypothetical protein
MVIKDMLKKLFYEWEWLCAYRFINEGESLPSKGQIYNYNIIKMPKNYWAADPFVFEKDGNIDIFFEYYSMDHRKGVLGHKRLNETDGRVNVIYEFQGHTSYPCIFEYKDNIYMIPETKADGTLVILKCVEYPLKWEVKNILLKNVKLVDSTPFWVKGIPYIFLYEENVKNVQISTLSIGELDIEEGKIKNIVPAIRYEKSTGRPAGHVLMRNDEIIRVTQPGINHYGENVSFYVLKKNSRGQYTESECAKLTPNQIAIDANEKIVGVHTFNRSKNVEVIDVLTKGHVSLFRPIRYVLQTIGICGYDNLEKKKRYLYDEFSHHLKE